jgi:hypothetical protein
MAKKRKQGMIPPGQPSRAEFEQYARSKGIDPKLAGDQWDIWDVQEWCDGNGTPILSWKGKLLMFHKMEFGMFAAKRKPARQERDRVAEADKQARRLEQLKRDEERRDSI